jgi:hypothetical protein
MQSKINPYLLSADGEVSHSSRPVVDAQAPATSVNETTTPVAPNVIIDGPKIKLLPPSVVKDIEQKNIARKLAGLSPIVIKTRRCIACGSMFESAGNRTCGCSSRTAGTIAGREII